MELKKELYTFIAPALFMMRTMAASIICLRSSSRVSGSDFFTNSHSLLKSVVSISTLEIKQLK